MKPFPAGSRSASFQSAISPPNNGPQQPKSDFSTGTMAPGGLRSWLSSQASLVCNGPLAQRKFPVLWTRQRRAPNFAVTSPRDGRRAANLLKTPPLRIPRLQQCNGPAKHLTLLLHRDLACTQERRITSCNSRTANWLNFVMSFRRIGFDFCQLCASSTSSSDAGGSECIVTA